MGPVRRPPILSQPHTCARLDPRGTVRARLHTVGASTAVSVHDQRGVTRARLPVGADDVPGRVFHDRHGEVRGLVGLLDSEPIVGLRA